MGDELDHGFPEGSVKGRLLCLGVVLLAVARAGTGGETSAAPPADPSDARIHFDTSSFLYTRLSSEHSSALYGGYALGIGGLLFGVVWNPRNGYREVIGGAVARLASGHFAVSVALAGAGASDGTYMQVYVVSSLDKGPWSLTGTLELYEPWGGRGIRQLYLDPVLVLHRIGPRWKVGATYWMGLVAGDALAHRAGPALQVALGGGSFRTELLHDFRRSSNDLRVAYQASF